MVNEIISYAFQRWDFFIVLAFMVGRIIMNFEIRKLSVFFVISYVVFAVWMLSGIPLFVLGFVLFLTLDSMIGTFLATKMKKFDGIYYGTMGVNFVFITILILNFNGLFF